MVDNIVKGVIFGLLAYAWYYVGTAVPWTGDGAYMVQSNIGISYAIPSFGYMIFSVFAFVMARK